MKNRKHFFCLLTLVLLSLSLLAGCGSLETKWSDTAKRNTDDSSTDARGADELLDGYGTITRNGKCTLVCVCHDREAVYLYNYDEAHELLATAEIPEEIYDENWYLGRFSFYDYDDDGNSDLQVTLCHDMSESYIHWTWVKDEGYVFKWEESEFYHFIVLRYPDDYDLENEFLDEIYPYVGVWLSDADDPYNDAYIEIDWNAHWTLYASGGIVDEGCLCTEPEEDYICSNSDSDSAITDSRVEVEGDRLYIADLGSFTHLVLENDSEDSAFGGNPEMNQRDVAEFEGAWYCDNDPSAETYILFDADGNWSYYQRGPGDAEGTEIDCGVICYSEEEVSTYYAESVIFDDLSYRVFDLDEDILIWNDEYTYYRIE